MGRIGSFYDHWVMWVVLVASLVVLVTGGLMGAVTMRARFRTPTGPLTREQRAAVARRTVRDLRRSANRGRGRRPGNRWTHGDSGVLGETHGWGGDGGHDGGGDGGGGGGGD